MAALLAALVVSAAVFVPGCSSGPRMPKGPAPEYEQPPLQPWDGGGAGRNAESKDEPVPAALPEPLAEPPQGPDAGPADLSRDGSVS